MVSEIMVQLQVLQEMACITYTDRRVQVIADSDTPQGVHWGDHRL
jgi:hypothetical protein